MAGPFDDLANADENAVDGKNPPAEKVVDWFHGRASTSRRDDIHHRIGFGEADAASGTHTHDGVNSAPLWADADYDLTALSLAATTAQIIAKINVMLAAMDARQS